MNKPNKISNFWKELKRRNVLRSLAIYAGSAFIFLEAATIVFPRWDFPDWTIDLVLYLIILGALITLVVAWIFDITPDGVQKTKPEDEIGDIEKPSNSNAWKIATYISLVVIVALIVFNVLSSTKTVKAGDIQSLVILPFNNFTGVDTVDYVTSGMHSMLISDVGKISGLRTIGKTSSDKYQGKDVSLTQIASELNVDAAIETDFLCLGDDTICLQVRLIHAGPEEEQLWIGDYRVGKNQILNLYNQLAKQIADQVKVSLTQQEESLLTRSRTVNKEAYDAYLKGLQYWDRLGFEDLHKAMKYFETAIEKEPDWAPPYAGIAQTAQGLVQMGGMLPGEGMPIIFKNRSKALELDPDYPGSHYTNALSAAWVEWNWEYAEKEFKMSLELNPNDAKSRIYYAHLLAMLGRYDEAYFHAQKAVDIDPYDPLVLALAVVGDVSMGNFQDAVDKCEKALEIEPGHPFAFIQSEEAYYFNGNYAKALEVAWAFFRNYVGITLPLSEVKMVNQNKGYAAAQKLLLSDVEKSLKEGAFMPPVILASHFLRIPNINKALDYFEKGYEIHDQNLPYLKIYGKLYPELKNESRYIELLKKMNLPLPEE